NLAGFRRVEVPAAGLRPASVAVCVVSRGIDASRRGAAPPGLTSEERARREGGASEAPRRRASGDTERCLLMTRRARTLRSHAGQWALPGGRRDAGESAADAALRELREETGVAAAADDVLGMLDDYATRSGYLITPVVVWGGPVSLAMSGPASEVAEIHVIPLADLDVAPRL